MSWNISLGGQRITIISCSLSCIWCHSTMQSLRGQDFFQASKCLDFWIEITSSPSAQHLSCTLHKPPWLILFSQCVCNRLANSLESPLISRLCQRAKRDGEFPRPHSGSPWTENDVTKESKFQQLNSVIELLHSLAGCCNLPWASTIGTGAPASGVTGIFIFIFWTWMRKVRKQRRQSTKAIWLRGMGKAYTECWRGIT